MSDLLIERRLPNSGTHSPTTLEQARFINEILLAIKADKISRFLKLVYITVALTKPSADVLQYLDEQHTDLLQDITRKSNEGEKTSSKDFENYANTIFLLLGRTDQVSSQDLL